MMPAAKHFDPVLGIDIHIVQPPGPVPPVPIPHPFVGFLIDPFDYVPILGATVMVNGLPRAQAGTMGKAVPVHIPIGGMFVKPPANECEMFMGSMTVEVDGDAFSYLALPTLSCQDIGMPPPPRINPKKKSKVKSLVLPTSMVLPIPAGPPVLVGGPPTISLMAMGMKVGMAALGKAFKKLRALQKGSRRMRALSERMRRAANKALDHIPGGDRVRNAVSKGICGLTGHPVDVATGKVLTDAVDFELPGPLPLRFERTWYSTSTYHGPLGHGWHHSYDLALLIYPDGIVARLGDGRYAAFDEPQSDAPSWDPLEKLVLHRMPDGYALEDTKGVRYVFASVPEQPDELLLHRIHDRNGNTITFQREGRRLLKIVDSVGRELPVAMDEANRIIKIEGPDPSQPGKCFPMVSYGYDEYGDLVEVRDALDHPFRYTYNSHLLAKETDRNAVSFYFEYDGNDNNSRCIRTWGDGGIYARKLDYDLKNQCTTVIDSHGYKTHYYWDKAGLIVREIDPQGGEKLYEWDDSCLKIAETNQCGETTSYEYDERGRLTAIIDPLGDRVETHYDSAGNAISFTDQAGNLSRREYDDRGNVVTVIDPEGNQWGYQVDERGLLDTVTDPLGKQTKVEWDACGCMRRLIDRTGAETLFEHDTLGRLIRRVDALQGQKVLTWDAGGRLIRVEESERTSQFRYDAEGNVLEAVDPLGRHRQYSYGPRGLLIAVKDPSGIFRRYHYNTEAKLVAVQDSRELRWTFERDVLGNVAVERTFDGRLLHYEYDAAGRLSAFTNAQGQKSELTRDTAGRLCSRSYPDGTADKFNYDPRGLIVKAENRAAVVEWEYDRLGRVVGESINGQKIESHYDALGKRISRTSPFGRILRMGYDAEGRLEAVSDPTGPLLTMHYDLLGREVQRKLPGDIVSERRYASTGELLSSRTQQRGATLLARDYRYNLGGQLEEIDDVLYGVTTFQHDLDGRLVAMIYPERTVERYFYDVAGNVPGIPDSSLHGSQDGDVSHVDDWQLRYDGNGNLIEKRDNSLGYLYEYDIAGRLARVVRSGANIGTAGRVGSNEQIVVEFGYDPLGRRVWKQVAGAESRLQRVEFLWDRNVLLGERRKLLQPGGETKIAEIEYFFRPDSFEPLVQLGGDGDCLIECDHLATPRAALNRHGDIVWQAQYRGFGGIKQERGQGGKVLFRYPGQYMDEDTGLYYNRFRYYDPELRRYTSPDPIGLAGGAQIWNYVRSPVGQIDPYGLVDPWDILYSQDTIDPFFQDTPEVPERWRGRPISEAIEEARELGKLPEGLQIEAMRVNDEWVTLNNRTLFVARSANLPNVNPIDVGPSGLNRLNRLLRDANLPGPVDEVKVRGCS